VGQQSILRTKTKKSNGNIHIQKYLRVLTLLLQLIMQRLRAYVTLYA